MVRWRLYQSLWVLTFFGLPNNHGIQLHTQIFEMCNYGNGFTMMDLYKLPTKLRNFYYRKLVSTKKAESEAIEKSKGKTSNKVRVKK